jgi:hypothetical protein
MDVHTSYPMAERGQGMTGVLFGEGNWARRGLGEEEVKRSKRGRCGAVKATGRGPLPERQTSGRQAKEAQVSMCLSKHTTSASASSA